MSLSTPPATSHEETLPIAPSPSIWHTTARRVWHKRKTKTGLLVLLSVALASLIVPSCWPYGIGDASWDAILSAPTLEHYHWFGTDANGRDLLVRVFYGGRVSLTIGFMTTLVALVIGVTYGSMAGFATRHVDNLMMRVVDILYALPLLFFIIILVTVFGRNIYLIFLAIGCVEWLTMARIVRGQTLMVKTREFVQAARAIGVPPSAILRRHIIPNILGPAAVYMTVLIPTNIVVESYLSFIGLGVQEPRTSWGLLIAQGAGELESAPWLIAFPATLLALTLFSFNFIGDGLRDALDPTSH